MSLLSSGTSDFFGLDIGTTGIRLVQLSGRDQVKTLQRYAYAPLEAKVSMSDSPADRDTLAQTIRSLVTKSGVSTKNVAVGLPSQRVFTTVVDIDRLSPDELAKSIRYQADSLIPTPLDESKVDWQQIGDSPADKTKVEVLLSSVPNAYAESRLDLLESIGLNVIAFEPDTMALGRALIAPGVLTTSVVLDMGSQSTDLAIISADAPRLTRSIPTGYEAVIRAATQNLNIDEAQARQFVAKFGVNTEKLEGQVLRSISSVIDTLTQELEKSLKFFQTRYPDNKIENIIMTGNAATLPEFPLYVANKFGISVEIGNAWRNVSFSKDRQNELMAISNQFAVAAGLAERAS